MKDGDAEEGARKNGESERRQERMPAGPLILLPLRNTVVFPGPVATLTFTRAVSTQGIAEAVRREEPVGLVAQRSPVDAPGPEDLFSIGTVADILRMAVLPDGQTQILVHGWRRFRIRRIVQTEPFFTAEVESIPEVTAVTTQLEARVRFLRQQAHRALSLLPQPVPEMAALIDQIDNPALLTDLIAATLDISPAEKQELLETTDLEERMRRVSEKLARQIEILDLTRKISSETRDTMDRAQREYILREQMRTIKRELGEEEGREAEAAALRRKIEDAHMPHEVEQQALREAAHLERTPEASPEHSMVRTYLEWLTELPWNAITPEVIDIPQARYILDEDHHDLDKVKRRILEFLAIRKLNPTGKSPLLCFVGPPGVGKTSLGQSIARATGRRFVRQSLGGVHDEAEIRGHRRTYVGALPGRIIQGLRKAGSRNPVFMLDEIDKLSASFHGDPSAALLEVLDPEQNQTFEDHYLGVPFDLRQVMFIGTANNVTAIPGPLRDRMEVIELPGYTEEDKVVIARRYLLRRQFEAAGLAPAQLRIEEDAIREIIRAYTREAGVRQLERELAAICRAVAIRFAEGHVEPVTVRRGDVRAYLGPVRFFNEVALRTSVPGVATGLAWTPTGGEILFIEATRMPGEGKLILTGQLGDVMKESAQTALSLAKSRAGALGIAPEMFSKSDIHVHVPSGAIPKDGPSAGVALFVALVSLLLQRRVRHDVGMTGEISLRGLVLPVGGVKEKVLAARRAGIRRVLLPELNRGTFEEEIPRPLRDELEVRFVQTVDQALELSLAPEETAAFAPLEREAALGWAPPPA
jgi:ATP-dependent Lon protease